MNSFAESIRFLYNIIITIGYLLIKLLPINPQNKTSKWISAQKKITHQYSTIQPSSVVFIVASSGEFEQAKPLVEKMKQNGEIVTVCFFSPSGYEQLQNNVLIDQVFYLPFDKKSLQHQLVSALKPKVVLFVKYELWLNLMTELRLAKIPKVLVSAVFKEDHFITKWFGEPWKKELKEFNQIFVQDKESQTVLKNINIIAQIAGDTRIDRSLELPKTSYVDAILESTCQTSTKLIIGSAWAEDIQLFAEIKDWLTQENIQLIIAPHELKKEFINNIKNTFNAQLYSASPNVAKKHLIIDKIGILKYIYRYGDVAYIGGGFGKGIHNTLEPASYALPIIFGPNHKKFLEANTLIKKQGGFEINNSEELKKTLALLIQDKNYIEKGTNAKQFLIENAGATKKIFSNIKEYLSKD